MNVSNVKNFKPQKFAEMLGVTVRTLQRWDVSGKLKAYRTPTNRRYYTYEQYLLFKNGTLSIDEDFRKSVIYARVSTQKQKNDLDNQISSLSNFCMNNGYIVSNIYSDIASGINFEKRKQFFEMLDEIIEGKIERVVISYKDRLSRVGFELFTYLFEQYHCDIIVANEIGNEKLDSEDIFEEIVSLLHCYSMKMYSKRRINNLKKVIEDKELEDNDSSEN